MDGSVSISPGENAVLLPESSRSSLPFVAALALQSSVVLLLAIPWTVQTIRSNIQAPSVLLYQPLKPVEPPKRSLAHEPANNSLPAPTKHVQLFRLPVPTSLNPNAISAPEMVFDSGAPFLSGDAGRAPGGVVHLGFAPFVLPYVQPIHEAQKQIVPVGGKVQAAKLIHQVQPIYPPLARQARIQGMVILESIIGTDGTIQQLKVMSGHPLLIQSAVQAVQQWKYLPTVLNEKAVEVKTTIEVRFTLSETSR
jgi:protein TonB